MRNDNSVNEATIGIPKNDSGHFRIENNFCGNDILMKDPWNNF